MASHRCLVVKKYQIILFLFWGVVHGGSVVGGSLLVLDPQARETRSAVKFMAGPDGSPCELREDKDDNTYVVPTDDVTGRTCDLCPIGQVLVSDCTMDGYTKCRLLIRGEERMPHPNFCRSGYRCKACPSPSQTVKQLCEPHGKTDTECECATGFFRVNREGDMCEPLPRCSKGFEPRPGASLDGVSEMICQKCGVGFYQPNDNSTDLCRIHTNCITTAGTDVSDNVCRGDLQSSESTATSSDEGTPSVEPTTPSTPSTRVPIGPTSPTPIGITDPPDQTGVPDNVTDRVVYHTSNNVKWYVVAIFTHVLCIFLGMAILKCYEHRKKIVQFFGRRADDEKKPGQGEENELPLRVCTNGSTTLTMQSSDEEATAEPNTVPVDPTTKKGKRYIQGKIKQRAGKRTK